MEKPDGGERQSLGFESRYGEGIGYAGLSLRTVRAGEQRPCRLGQEVGHTEEMEDATENAKQSQRLVEIASHAAHDSRKDYHRLATLFNEAVRAR